MNIVKHGIDADYRIQVVTFGKTIEMLAKPVNHSLELARSRSHGLRCKRFDDLTPEQRMEKDQENLQRSVRQSRKSVRYHVQRCEADHLLTLTYRENMQDKERLKADFKYFAQLVRAKYPEWHYIGVIERQERGAFHLHLAVKGRQDLHYLRTCWYRVLGCTGATGENVLGNVDVSMSKRKYGSVNWKWKPNQIAAYISKYIGKDFDINEHHTARYIASRGTPKPEVKRIWIACTDIQDMIMQMFDMAMLCGLEDFPEIWHSPDGTILKFSGLRLYKSSTSHNDALWSLD